MRFVDGQPLKGGNPSAQFEPLAETYQALVLAVRDYVTKNGFLGAVLEALRRHRLCAPDARYRGRCHQGRTRCRR